VIVVVIYSVVVYYEVCSEAALIITVLWPFLQDNLDEQLPDMTLAYASSTVLIPSCLRWTGLRNDKCPDQPFPFTANLFFF